MVSRSKWLGILALFLVGSLVIYRRILSTPPVIDDYYLLTHLPEGFLRLFANFRTHYFRPVIGFSLWVDHSLWGLNPFGYHLSNVLTHGLNAFLVSVAGYRLLRLLGSEEQAARFIAWVGGALFLVLPSHTEAVAWISGRTDVVAACFCLASLCAYLIGRDPGKRLLFWLSPLLFAAAVFAKESVLTFPLFLIAVEWFDRQRRQQESRVAWTARVAPFFGVLALYLVARWTVLGALVGGSDADVHLEFGPNVILPVFLTHVGSAFAPIIYRPAFLAVLGLMAAALALVLLRKSPAASAAYLLGVLFVLSVLPVINIDHMRHGEQERIIYLPSVFSTLLVAVSIYDVFARWGRWSRWASLAVAGALVLTFGWSLDRSCLLWNQAGQLTGQIIESARALPADRVIVLDMPRDLRGAWMLGNGLDSAPALYGWTSPAVVGTWIKVSLRDPSDHVEIVKEGTIWRMRLPGYRASRTFSAARPGRFLTPAELQEHRLAFAKETGRDALGPDWVGVKPPPLRPTDRLAVYRHGRLEDASVIPASEGK